jgi:SAM-dependent methyltransferase
MRVSFKFFPLLKDFLKAGCFVAPDVATSPYRHVEFSLIKAIASKYKNPRILELGPGYDPIPRHLDYDCNYTAVDYAEAILKEIDENFPKAHKVKFNFEGKTNIPKLGKFDIIFANSVIEHLEDDMSFVKLCKNHLAEDGVIFVSTVMHQRIYNSWDFAVGHFRRYSHKRLMWLGSSENLTTQTFYCSITQELIRPLFFSRIYHLCGNSLENNNHKAQDNFKNWSKPPYQIIWPLLKYLFPIYLIWSMLRKDLIGGIGFAIYEFKDHE